MRPWESEGEYTVTVENLDNDPSILTHRPYNLRCHMWRSRDRAVPPHAEDVVVVDVVDDGRWLHCSVRALRETDPSALIGADDRYARLRMFVTAVDSWGLSPIEGAVDLTRRQLAEYQRISGLEPGGDSRYMKVPMEMSGLSRVVPLALRVAGFDLGPRSPRRQRLEPDWMYDL